MTITLAETARPGLDLSLSLDLQASRANLWRCWTEGALLRRWFAPEPWSVPVAELDVRPGGTMRVTMRGPDGEENAGSSVYLEVVPQEKLVFTDAYTEGWKPAPDPFMTAILLLADAPGGGTLYTAIARHRHPDSRKSHEDMGFFDGWGTVATQLDAYAKGLMA